ncbi:hypothetical protein RvY_11237 [Ramazzottius varieornatus]|uniref:Uncharacterized protein n=1 Tax=Ramazzottius varieornatus TaxID=947166 RepID=A0A1D1VPB4_RAMVA|nr:hypothetical protein RvY_11237 [Ramazzottius varieornatus]
MADDEDEDAPPPPPPHIFVSRVDTYFGRILAQYLGQCIPGVLPNAEEQSEDEEGRMSRLDLAFLQCGPTETSYQLHGSWNGQAAPTVPALRTVIRADNQKDLYNTIKEANICVFHVIDEEGSNGVLEDTVVAINAARKIAMETKTTKTLILVSTVLTWGRSRKPIAEGEQGPEATAEGEGEGEEEDDDGTEGKHLELEKDFLKYGRDSKGLLITTVVAAGLLYGYGEKVLHWMFKEAWQDETAALQVPGDGKNKIPSIHVHDLCQIVQNICEAKPKSHYLIATDERRQNLSKVATAVSKALASGEVVSVKPEDLFSAKKLTQADVDLLTCDLKFTTAVTKDMQIQWVAEKGLFDYMAKAVQEFLAVRNLTALKLVVLGPPFAGKTYMAKRLAAFYDIQYLKVEEIIQGAIDNLRQVIIASKEAAAIKATMEQFEDAPDAEEEEGPTKGDIAQQMLDRIQESKAIHEGKLEDRFVIQFVREKLLTKACQNKGFVFDGFPDSYANAKAVFRKGGVESDGEEEVEPEEGDEDEEGGGAAHAADMDPRLRPDFVVNLEASDKFLRDKMMARPDSVVPDPTALTNEQYFNQKMAEYKASHNPAYNTVVDYFDETESTTISLNVEEERDIFAEICLKTAIARIGPPHNYGPTAEEKQAQLRIEEEKRRVVNLQKETRKKAVEAEYLAERQRRCGEWAARAEDLQKEKVERLELASMPVFEYLSKALLPAVEKGLLATSRVKPADPVDFLGEYFIQLINPLKVSGAEALSPDEQLRRATRSK